MTRQRWVISSWHRKRINFPIAPIDRSWDAIRIAIGAVYNLRRNALPDFNVFYREARPRIESIAPRACELRHVSRVFDSQIYRAIANIDLTQERLSNPRIIVTNNLNGIWKRHHGTFGISGSRQDARGRCGFMMFPKSCTKITKCRLCRQQDHSN